MLHRRLITVFLSLGLLATACGSDQDSTTAPAATDESSSDSASAEASSAMASALVAQTASGQDIDFAALGSSDTVLWFWAPW